MKPHLTSRQMSEALLGTVPPEAESHVLSCSACREQLDRLRSDLALFGNTVRTWSDGQLRDTPIAVPTERQLFFSFPRLAVASAVFAALLVALVFGVPSRLHRAQRVDGSIEDAALLQQIDAELSRTVPEPMEPLTRLVAIDRSESTQNPIEKNAKDEDIRRSVAR